MTPSDRQALEARVEALCREGRMEEAATATVDGYGPEILGFALNLLRDEALADDCFSLFCEDLWRGLAGFRWQASLRTWIYTLARNASARVRADPHRRAARNLALSASPAVAEAAVQVRTRTQPHLRTEVRDDVARLREALSEEDRLLLILRVDRALPWLEIAEVTAGDGADAATVKRESARLRKRFQLIKDQLREAAIQAGLLGTTG